MVDIYRLSDVEPIFRGRIVDIEAGDGGEHTYFNIGLYPGNSVILLHRDSEYIIVMLGRHIKKIEMDIATHVFVMEDRHIPFVD